MKNVLKNFIEKLQSIIEFVFVTHCIKVWGGGQEGGEKGQYVLSAKSIYAVCSVQLGNKATSSTL